MNMHLALLKRVIVLAACALVSSASAQTVLTSYDVELIVFRTLSAKASPEDWGMEAAAAGQHLEVPGEDAQDTETAPAAPPAAAPTQSFPALPAAKFKLTAIADTLRRTRNYQPLAHFGWTQPGFPRGEPHYMSIEGIVPATSGLSGQIALARGRYLHLTLELAYDSPEEGRMVLRQTRRMRSNERHYVDHPKFGVIAIITPSA